MLLLVTHTDTLTRSHLCAHTHPHSTRAFHTCVSNQNSLLALPSGAWLRRGVRQSSYDVRHDDATAHCGLRIKLCRSCHVLAPPGKLDVNARPLCALLCMLLRSSVLSCVPCAQVCAVCVRATELLSPRKDGAGPFSSFQPWLSPWRKPRIKAFSGHVTCVRSHLNNLES